MINFIQRSKFELVSLVLGICLLAVTAGSEYTREQKRFIPPPPIFRHFHFGYSETMADLFWIRVVQDFSVCEEAIDSIAGSNAGVTCRKGWVFQMLDLVTDLAPRFEMPYYYGATNLSVLVNDPQGAKVIFDKGLKQMPDVWDIAYRAAYHYLIELKDKETAAKLLIQAGKNGAPPWVFSLAGRLYTEEGKAFLAKSVLLSVLESEPDGVAAKAIKARLKLIDEELAKSKPSEKNEKPANSP